MFFNASRVLFVAVTALVVSSSSFAQNAPPSHVPLQKTIGAATPEVVPSLFVLNSKGATLQNGKLVLVGVSANAIVFADRPLRSAGHDLTSRIVEDWGNGSDNFQKDPPNATVSAFQKDGSGVRDAVVVLKNPKLEGKSLAFAARSPTPGAQAKTGFVLRQDLFDRADPNNFRSNWPAPPAQPGQF
jgi:hypothetical protein